MDENMAQPGNLEIDTQTLSQYVTMTIECQRRRDFVVFRRTENVEKWRVKVYSL